MAKMPIARKKLYLNENILHKLVATPLRELGYDVISSHEAGMDELDDYSQLLFAARRKRILVTFNRDDFERLHEQMIRSKQSHFGILYSNIINSRELVNRLRKFLDDSRITRRQMKNEIKNLDDWKYPRHHLRRKGLSTTHPLKRIGLQFQEKGMFEIQHGLRWAY